MSATINRKLNIVFAMRENKIWVHSMPISRAVYKAYFLPMSRAYEVIHGNNMHMTGPRNAALTLEKVSRDTGVWDGPDGIENGLMTEIRRLTNILTPVAGNNGWEMLPYQSAIMSNYLDEEDIDEIDNRIVFFILVSCIQLREKQARHLDLMRLYDVETTFLNVTEYQTSLQTSTMVANIGAKTAAELSPIS